jgi:DNA-binding NtrC family response regulator
MMRNNGHVQLIGTSQAITDLKSEVERVARSDAKVLITGESGSGKEVVARAINDSSGRAQTFVPVNCAGIPETLLESELFGHVKGSFTGAYRDKPGKLEMADHGTIFLDEIGEMTLRMQGLLLRFLETGEIQKVGAERMAKATDVRVMAATNKNLKDLISQGLFREDLFYRINVIHLIVPPLRERREDILPLAKHFLDQFNRSFGKDFRAIDPEAERILLTYPWPGNIRELRNLFERIVLLNQGDRILAAHLNAAIAGPPARGETRLDVLRDVIESGQFPDGGIDLESVLGDVEREIIQRAFDWTRGNQSRTATVLQMKRDKLRYRMKLYGFHDTATSDLP